MTSFPYNEQFLFISEIFLIIIEKSWVNVVYRVLAMLKEDFISSNKGKITIALNSLKNTVRIVQEISEI